MTNLVYVVKVVNRSDFATTYETPIVLSIEEANKIKAKLEEIYNILPAEEVEEAIGRITSQNPNITSEQIEEVRDKLMGPIAIQVAHKISVSSCEEWLRDHYRVNVVRKK